MLLAQLTNCPIWWQFLSSSKDSFSSLESIAKIIAIILAGVWAIHHFFIKREAYPSATLNHRVEILDYSESEWLVRLNLSIKNDGKVLMRIFERHTWVQQLQPWPAEVIDQFKEDSKDPNEAPSEALWPLIGEKLHRDERELEPGESDEICMDFFIEKAYRKVLVYSFIKNYAKAGRNLGWSISAVLELAKQSSQASNQAQGQTVEKQRPGKAHLPNH